MTMGGPLTVFGMRYCTYIWLTVMVPGTEGPTAGVPGWLEVVVTPLTKKLPSSASSSGPPSDAAMVVPPVASSVAAAAIAAQKFQFLRIMARSPRCGRWTTGHPAVLPPSLGRAYGARAGRQANSGVGKRCAPAHPQPQPCPLTSRVGRG